ncbi:MAG TPA: RDD family protein [Thermoplasmata archaeon]|nr:RDD family protein [Thermoplasmata archaeon]
MVDAWQLTSDIVAYTVSLAAPALLWVLVFLIAWERAPFAESIGFGRRAFWLLLPGAVFGSFGLLPIAPVSTDWVAVSLAGAMFPLLVGLLAFGRAAPPRSRSLSRYLLLLAVAGGLLFLLVLPATTGLSSAFAGPLGVSEYIGNEIVVLIDAVALAGVIGGASLASPDPLGRKVAFLFLITSGVLVSTFVASSAIPGVGITESFPFYLVPPLLAGLVAAAVAGRVFPGEEAFAIPTAFLGSTFGVLLGADLLRQPPLYGTGPSGVYTIGGAGVFDLVYLSGFLAFAGAYFGHRLYGRSFAPVGTPVPTAAPSPTTQLARAFRSGLDGQLTESLHESAAAGRSAAAQARQLLALPPGNEDRPWQDLHVPGWLVADQANLESSAKAGTTDGREGFRAWRTARWMVLVGRDLGLRRFGGIGVRALAFLVDLVLVTVPAVIIWAVLLATIPGGVDAALSNVTFNAAIYGFITWAFLYFVLAETFVGTTLGKRLFGLEVRERSFQSPTGLSSLVRNSTVLPLLTVVGIGLAIALAYGLKGETPGSLSYAGVALPSSLFALAAVIVFVAGGVGLLGGGAVVLIAATAERQRLGDLWAGTWVVRRMPEPAPTGPTVPTGAEAPPFPAVPPGAGRFG